MRRISPHFWHMAASGHRLGHVGLSSPAGGGPGGSSGRKRRASTLPRRHSKKARSAKAKAGTRGHGRGKVGHALGG